MHNRQVRSSAIHCASQQKIMIDIKNVVFIFIFCFCIVFVDLAMGVEQMQTYTVADGLVGPVVPVIFQDSRGGLWVGSDRGGVSRFDGKNFVSYSGFPEGSENGQAAMLSTTSEWSTKNVVIVEPGALLGHTLQIVEDKWGHIWFLSRVPSETEGRISRFNGAVIEKIGTGNWLIVDLHGDVWIGENHRLTKYTTPGVQHPPHPHPIQIVGEDLIRSAASAIHVIFESQDGTLWLGGSDGERVLILSFRPMSGFTRPDTRNLQVSGAIRAITQDASGNLWFGGEDFLLRFDGETFKQILPTPSTAPNRRSNRRGRTRARQLGRIPFSLEGKVSIQSDKQGRIWFSDGRNLKWWDGSRLRELETVLGDGPNTRQNLPGFLPNARQNLRGFLKIEDAWGNLWFASTRGAHQYDTNLNQTTYRAYRADDGLGSDSIHTIFEAMDGKLWFGHDNGVTVFDPIPAIVNYPTPELGSNSVRLMYEDSSGHLWFSVLGGVALYNAETEKLGSWFLHRLNVAPGQNTPFSRTDPNLREASPSPSGPRIDIVKMFEVDGHVWFIDKPVQRRLSTQYTLFRYANEKFDQISISIRTVVGPGGERLYSNPDVLVSEGKHPWIALGGWLFKPDATGLQWLSEGGFLRILFQTTRRISHAPSAITALHRDTQDQLWCHLENGEVRRYPKTLDTSTRRRERIHPEILSLKAAALLKADSEAKWFFNVATGKLIHWVDKDGGKSTELKEVFSSGPLAVWQSPTEQRLGNGDSVQDEAANGTPRSVKPDRITFIFSDSLKTYQGRQLIFDEAVDIAPVQATLTSQTGVLWLATSRGAVRYDGEALTTYTTYTTKDGFLVDDVRDVMEDSWGNIWFATWGGGVVRYDGETFEAITTKKGLKHNNVSKIHESKQKHIWFATEGGATQYEPTRGELPFCKLTSVEADKPYTQLSTTLVLPARARDITFNFRGISPLREKLAYQFKLIGVDTNEWTNISAEAVSLLAVGAGIPTSEWAHPSSVKVAHGPLTYKGGVVQKLLHQNGSLQIQYTGLKAGTYTFLIKALREGWPHQEPPAALNVIVLPPFWTRWRTYLPTLIFITAVVSLLGRLLINRRHTAQLRAEMREKEEAEVQRIRAELNEAQNIQMGLLPPEAPYTEGFEVAGMSAPATQVGGDFYDYVTVANGQTAVAVADAAGKGLRGAMNAVLTNGMLHEVARFKSDADVILTDLNAGLAPRMYGPSFIALNLAILDESQKRVDYANGGQPYPILKRGAEIIEIESSDLPLGSMKRVEYESVTFDLTEGDTLVFHTDGLIEALNADEDMYGAERLKLLISQIPNEASAEEVIQRIVEDVHNFVGEAEQYDDLTLVVIKRLQSSQSN